MNKIILSILIAFISCNNLRKTAEWNFETFQKELVARHNEYRKKHAASSLTILKDLTILCQKTVDNCKKIGRLHHRDFNLDDGTLVGQNLYFTNSTPTGNEVADNWYSDIEYYDYNGDKIEEKTSHFTQMVWKNTKQIGCAVAVDLLMTHLIIIMLDVIIYLQVTILGKKLTTFLLLLLKY